MKSDSNRKFKIRLVNPWIHTLFFMGLMILLILFYIVPIAKSSLPMYLKYLSGGLFFLILISLVFCFPYKILSKISYSDIIITINHNSLTLFSINSKRYIGKKEVSIDLDDILEIKRDLYNSKLSIEAIYFYRKSGLVSRIYLIFKKKYCTDYLLFLTELEKVIEEYNVKKGNIDINLKYMSFKEKFTKGY